MMNLKLHMFLKKLTKNSRLKKYLDKRSVNEQQEDKKRDTFSLQLKDSS